MKSLAENSTGIEMKKKTPCLKILISQTSDDLLPWLLTDLGARAVETRDRTTMTSVEEGKIAYIAGFGDEKQRDAACEKLRFENGIEAVPIDIGDDGWSVGWRDFFKPVVLDTLVVTTPWMKESFANKIPVVIDPGLAFGTGGHATTRLIIRMLEEMNIHEKKRF